MLSKNRIEAFSDGVIAIITIMAFDLKIPELAKDFSDQDVWKALEAVVPKILSYNVEVNAQLLPYNEVVQRSNLVSTLLYLASIPLAFVSVYLSFLIFVGIPLWYFLPDRFRK